MNNTIQAIILAAGKSTRFNTEKTKLLYTICGQAMILFSTKLLEQLTISTTVIVGYQEELIKNSIIKEHGNAITFVTQEKQNGTGHALACSQPLWTKDHILVLNGDVPLITTETITSLYENHIKENAAISFVTTCTTDETVQAYGKVVKTEKSIAIVEAKDFKGNIKDHCCINAGIYLINKTFLESYIAMLTTNNASNEFYITDLVKIASDNNLAVVTVKTDFNTVRGINTFHELSEVEHIKRSEIIHHWMSKGVHFAFPQTIHIDNDVTIGAGTYIGSHVQLKGNTKIGNNCTIQNFSLINNCIIDDKSSINSHCALHNTHVESYAEVPPFTTTNTALIKSHHNNIYTTDTNQSNTTEESLKAFSFTGARVIHPFNPSDDQ